MANELKVYKKTSRIALKKYGILKGSILTAKRIAKCNSLFKGGYDPVP